MNTEKVFDQDIMLSSKEFMCVSDIGHAIRISDFNSVARELFKHG